MKGNSHIHGLTTIEEAKERRLIPALDGLRAVAIFMVLMHHGAQFTGHTQSDPERLPYLLQFWLSAASVGWVGVDLFFVLSGFLITRVLLALRERQHPFMAFYIRRAQRILPVYALMLIVASIACFKYDIFFRPDRTDWLHVLPWYLSFTQNVLIAAGKLPVDMVWMVTFWSLAVEEQFYVIWPLIMLIFARKRLLVICVLIVALAVTGRIIAQAIGVRPGIVQCYTIFRADSFALGALVAVIEDSAIGRKLQAALDSRLAAVLLLIVIYTIFLLGGAKATTAYSQDIGYLLVALMVAYLILSILFKQRSFVNKFLEIRSIRHFGRLSYGLYAYHYPIMFAFFHLGLRYLNLANWPIATRLVFMQCVATFITYCVALASWHFIEEPCLRWRRGVTQ